MNELLSQAIEELTQKVFQSILKEQQDTISKISEAFTEVNFIDVENAFTMRLGKMLRNYSKL